MTRLIEQAKGVTTGTLAGRWMESQAVRTQTSPTLNAGITGKSLTSYVIIPGPLPRSLVMEE